MFTFRIIQRQHDRTTTRRPLVEGLEGRELLSTFTPADVKKDLAALALSHTVAPFATAIQGGHLGANVAAVQVIRPGIIVLE